MTPGKLPEEWQNGLVLQEKGQNLRMGKGFGKKKRVAIVLGYVDVYIFV